MATIKINKFLSAIYTDMIRDTVKTRIAIIGGPTRNIGLTFEVRGETTYTRLYGKKKDKLLICLGGRNICQIAGLPETLSSARVAKGLMPGIIKAFHALVNHELGHDLFTDMYDTSIVNYKEPKYINFMHNMFNILEDQVIEYCMEMYYKKNYPYDVNPRVYFDFMIENMFMPQGEDYKDDGTQAGFMNYTLLFFRIGEKNIKNRCAVFDKYKSDLFPLFKKVIGEPDGTLRIKYTIELCEWIIENIKEFDWELPPLSEHEKLSGKAAGMPGAPMPMPGFGGASMPGGKAEGADDDEEASFGEEAGGGEDKDEEGSKGSEEDEEESEEPEDEEEEEEEDEEEEDEEEEDPAYDESRVESSVDEEIVDEIFNDVTHDGRDHEWVSAKDEYEVMNDKIIETINKYIDEFSDVAKDLSDFFSIFKGRIKPMNREGLTSGRLSSRLAIRDDVQGGVSTKLFKKKLSRGKDADLCVSILADNSGSMCGNKSTACTKALLALAQACDWCNIPFEVNAFTKTSDSWSGISITITEKAFEDSFENSKPYFAINDSDLIGGLQSHITIPTFHGNSEEVNIYYIGEKFKRVKHKTKLMFVLCDGMTTGSRNELREVITRLEADYGIIVVGIGVLDNGVIGTYHHTKVFNTMEELETELAPYLIDTLGKYAV